MQLSKSKKKLSEITRVPETTILKILRGITVYLGLFIKWGKERGGFLEGLGMGADTFFEVSNMGARTFLKLKKRGQELFLACEIGGLVIFFDRKIPQNPACIPR